MEQIREAMARRAFQKLPGLTKSTLINGLSNELNKQTPDQRRMIEILQQMGIPSDQLTIIVSSVLSAKPTTKETQSDKQRPKSPPPRQSEEAGPPKRAQTSMRNRPKIPSHSSSSLKPVFEIRAQEPEVEKYPEMGWNHPPTRPSSRAEEQILEFSKHSANDESQGSRSFVNVHGKQRDIVRDLRHLSKYCLHVTDCFHILGSEIHTSDTQYNLNIHFIGQWKQIITKLCSERAAEFHKIAELMIRSVVLEKTANIDREAVYCNALALCEAIGRAESGWMRIENKMKRVTALLVDNKYRSGIIQAAERSIAKYGPVMPELSKNIPSVYNELITCLKSVLAYFAAIMSYLSDLSSKSISVGTEILLRNKMRHFYLISEREAIVKLYASVSEEARILARSLPEHHYGIDQAILLQRGPKANEYMFLLHRIQKSSSR